MSIDPSSLPRSTFVPAAPVVKPSADLINQVLDELQVNHFTDDEGDICAPWDGFRVYFMLRGDKHEIFTVRMFLDREFAPPTARASWSCSTSGTASSSGPRSTRTSTRASCA